MPFTVFLTGATGLLGSHIAAHCLRRGWRVMAWRRPHSSLDGIRKTFACYGLGERALDDIQWVTAPAENLSTAHLRGADAVVHSAAAVSFSPADRHRLYQSNVRLTERLLAAAAPIGLPFHFISSVAVLDRTRRRPLREEDRAEDPAVLSYYGYTKWLAEGRVMEYHRRMGGGLILRPAVILGCGDRRRSSLQIVRAAARAVPFYPPGSVAVVNARDVAAVLVYGMERIKRGFPSPLNVVGFVTSYRRLLACLAHALETKPPRWQLPMPLLRALGWSSDMLSRLIRRPLPLSSDVVRTMGNSVQYDLRRLREAYPEPLADLETTCADAAQSK